MPEQLPPEWPEGVHPPGSETFERSAVQWLLDRLPADYRVHGLLRRHPVILARIARDHTAAALEAARAGYRTARVDLRDAVPVHAVEQLMRLYAEEGERMAAVLRGIELIRRGLAGRPLAPSGQRERA
ncbi:hypothetical protein [Allonocardiopsis opalescens]|uniref:Uncharacterized protein n=1 Tax=Allonocardiopsis opalescens TaxID=1144618 RepID=A0A2T0Q239_9ACTN|nr:hypothetical protein [Allonocardiopsis opalescens]PRX97865.1 hypothetical protein CLV72_105215 [Allonocardiopsis opalescens]